MVTSQATVCDIVAMDQNTSAPILLSDLSLISSHHLIEAELWHHRMEHTNCPTIHQMCLNNSVLDFTPMKMISSIHPCPKCMYRKTYI